MGIARSVFGFLPTSDKSRHLTQTPLMRAIIQFTALEAILVVLVSAGAVSEYSRYYVHDMRHSVEISASSFILAMSMSISGFVAREYRSLSRSSFAMAIWTGLVCSVRAGAVLLLYQFLVDAGGAGTRGATAVALCAATLTVTLGRAAFAVWIKRAVLAGRVVSSRIVVIAEPGRMVTIAAKNDLIDRLRNEGGDIVRVIALPTFNTAITESSLIATAVEVCRSGAADSVVILPSASAPGVTERLVAALSEVPLTIHVVPFEARLGGLDTCHGRIAGQPAIVIKQTALGTLSWAFKRVFDVAVASVALVAISPVFLCVAIAIKLDSPGPVLFRQTRHGYGNRVFRVFKFRSMRVMEDGAAFRQAIRNDPRVTKVGRVLRASNLDELPQLLNVISGDMSLVGPRPHPVKLNDDFASRIRLYNRRHNILPGITGWAQVNGYRGETDDEIKMRNRVEHDLWYVDNWSLPLDLRILVLTVFSGGAYRNAG